MKSCEKCVGEKRNTCTRCSAVVRRIELFINEPRFPFACYIVSHANEFTVAPWCWQIIYARVRLLFIIVLIRTACLLHTETICLLCRCYFIFSHRCCVISSGKDGVVGEELLFPLPSFSFQNGGIQPNVDPWTLSACALFVSLRVFKDWRAESDTRGDFWVCVHTHAHAIDGFGMHSQRVNRVTSSGVLLSVKAVNPGALCYISGHLHDIRCPLPASPAHTETMTLVCFAPLLWRWRGGDFRGKVKEGTASRGRGGKQMMTERRLASQSSLKALT